MYLFICVFTYLYIYFYILLFTYFYLFIFICLFLFYLFLFLFYFLLTHKHVLYVDLLHVCAVGKGRRWFCRYLTFLNVPWIVCNKVKSCSVPCHGLQQTKREFPLRVDERREQTRVSSEWAMSFHRVIDREKWGGSRVLRGFIERSRVRQKNGSLNLQKLSDCVSWYWSELHIKLL